MKDIGIWLVNNFWQLLVIYFIIRNLGGFNEALKGSNGKWQMDEIAKLVILALTVFAFSVEATRSHEWRFFSDTVFLLLLFVLIMMAKMEPVLDKFNEFIEKWKK